MTLSHCKWLRRLLRFCFFVQNLIDVIDIEGKLVSRQIFEKKFVCDLNACKGICCVSGDSGAPLLESEKQILEDVYPSVREFMRDEAIRAVEEQGTSVTDFEGDLTTPLVNNAECAYVYFNDNGIALCAHEAAFTTGKSTFPKPLSCHLYPIRITRYKNFDALNYHEWNVCEPACTCGEALQIPVFKFLKKSLIRAYGKDWYKKLELAADMIQQSNEKK
jgi:hypothetical protein